MPNRADGKSMYNEKPKIKRVVHVSHYILAFFAIQFAYGAWVGDQPRFHADPLRLLAESALVAAFWSVMAMQGLQAIGVLHAPDSDQDG